MRFHRAHGQGAPDLTVTSLSRILLLWIIQSPTMLQYKPKVQKIRYNVMYKYVRTCKLKS